MAVPRRADRRGPRQRHQPDRARAVSRTTWRSAPSRPPQLERVRRGRSTSRASSPPSTRRSRQSERQDQGRRRRPHHPGGARHRGRRPRRRRAPATTTRTSEAEARPRPAHLARPGEVRRGRQGRRQGLREGRPGPRGRLPEEHRRPGRRSSTRWTPSSRTGLKNTRHQDLRHHPRRLRLPRRALRPDQEAISGLDPESEPSAARIKDLQTIAKKPTTSPPSSSRRSPATRPRRPWPGTRT